MTATGVWSNWDTISAQFQRFDEKPASPVFGYYCQNIFEMKDQAGTFSVRERGMFGIHWINTTGGDLDTTWVTADFTSVETAVQTMWTALLAYIPQDFRLVEHRWYSFGPGVVAPNPPARVTTIGSPLVGSSTTLATHQVAHTVTLRTAIRRHWGRFYLPLSGSLNATGGQLGSSTQTTFHGAAKTMLAAPGTAQGVAPVVYDRNRKVALGVTAVEMDSVPDIQRRRRPRTAANKIIATS